MDNDYENKKYITYSLDTWEVLKELRAVEIANGGLNPAVIMSLFSMITPANC